MKLPEQTLMAYADGELDPAARAEVEAEMARDPEVARAVERHRALAARVRCTYDAVLEERVPARLAALASQGGVAPAGDLAARRERRGHAAGRAWLPTWAAAAASLAIGVMVGLLIAREPEAPYATIDGALVARGDLDAALTSQLATPSDEAGIAIGISFRDRDGAFCRTFQMDYDAPIAGLACRVTERWRIDVLAAASPATGELRPAAAMPIAVLEAVDASIDGDPLDAASERAARDAGWR